MDGPPLETEFPEPDLAAVKTRQQAAWSSGDYAVVGTTLQIVGEELCEALDLRAGQKVLDVAAGNGNATLAAARRWCEVTSTDYVPALLERGRARAAAEGLTVEFQEADAEDAAVRRRRLRRGALDLRRHVHAEPGQGGGRAAARLQAAAARSASPTGRRTASSASCSRRSASTCRRRPASKSPALWGTRARLDELFGPRRQLDQDASRAISCSATARPSTSSMCSRPTTARC